MATLKNRPTPKEDPRTCTLTECKACYARPSPPNWSAPMPYRHVHADAPFPLSKPFDPTVD